MTTTKAVTIIARTLTVGALVLTVAACSFMGGGRARILPDEPGLYASEGENLVRLNGDHKWEAKTWKDRAALKPNTEFVIYHPALAQGGAAATVHLEKVAWVRSQVDPDGSVRPLPGNTWAQSHLDEFQIPLELRQVDLHRDMLIAIPKQPLQPGLYSFQLRTANGVINTRFGVGWPGIDRQAYSAATCVDRYTGAKTHYRRCTPADNGQRAAGGGLKLYLVSPQANRLAEGRSMVVQGVIVNTASTPQSLPLLEAYLTRADGQVLRRWRFRVGAGTLAAGQSTSFRTKVEDPPLGAEQIHVRFTGSRAN